VDAEDPLTARHWWSNPSAAAVIAWLVASPVALFVPQLVHYNPFGNRAWALVFAIAFAVVGIVSVISVRWSGETLAGVGAGLLAAWTIFALRMTLVSTEFGYGGLYGDAGRMAALANRYTTTIKSVDAWVPGVVSEYPPLYPWVIGRAAVVTGIAPWHMLAIVQCLTISAAVVAGFMLWRRMVPAWVALAVVAPSLLAVGDPRKAYEVLALYVFLPWAVATVGRPPRGRLHWLPAGIIGGLLLQLYLGWFIFGSIGLVAIAYFTWRRSTDRPAYLLHLLKVIGVSMLVAAWYLGPYLWEMLTSGTNAVSDMFEPEGMNLTLFPFLDTTPVAALELIGLSGLVWFARKTWWAPLLLALAAGAFAYRVIATIRYAFSGHTMFYHYSVSLYGTVLVIAGVLVLVRAVPQVLKRLDLTAPARAGAAALAVLMLYVPYMYSREWFPAGLNPASNYLVQAYLEPKPEDGSYSLVAPAEGRVPWLPVYQIRKRVESVRGAGAKPVTLSCDERFFAYIPWPGYVGTSRLSSNSLVRWDDRVAEVAKLATTTDPAAFARDSAATAFGPIDVFILIRDGVSLRWAAGIRFTQAQFDPAVWAIDDLPGNTVVVTRRS
jgi:hypothetical protein